MQAKKFLPVLAATLLLAIPFRPALAQTGSALDRIEVSGQPALRADVSRACPNAQQALEDGMALQLSRVMLPGSYRVEFELQGNRIDSVRTRYAPLEYRQAIRSAVRSMACSDSAAQTAPQRFAFILDVISDDARKDTALAGAPSRQWQLALRAAD